jgi:hypothetical protein
MSIIGSARRIRRLDELSTEFDVLSSHMEAVAAADAAWSLASIESRRETARASSGKVEPSMTISSSSDDSSFFVPNASSGTEAGAFLSGPAKSTLYYSPVIRDGAANCVSVPMQAYVTRAGGLFGLGSMFSISPVNGNLPASVVASFYDRDNYAGRQTYAYGTLVGRDGERDSASAYSISFSLKNGRYVSSTGLGLADYVFVASAQENRLQNITLSAYSLTGAALGTRNVDIVTSATARDATMGVATGAELAATARSMIGRTWNDSGCWVLASNVAAMSGVSLTINSGFVAPSMQGSNGQMSVVYDASKGISSAWASTLREGDMVEVAWGGAYGGGGHIFTIDRIAGGTTYLVDNSGRANTGISTDVTVAERALSSYLPYVDQSSVVVFRASGAAPNVSLPTATTLVNPWTDVVCGTSVSCSSLFSATDASGRAITAYSVRNDGSAGSFSYAGSKVANGQWFTVSSSDLSRLSYVASSQSAVSDTIEVKAFDGTWGSVGMGRVVSLSSLSGQATGSFGTLSANKERMITDWISSGSQSWSFSVGSGGMSVGIALSASTSALSMSILDSSGRTLASGTKAAFGGPLVAQGTLGAGSYVVRVSGSRTNYDLDVGDRATVLASVPAAGASFAPRTATTTASAPSVTGFFGGMDPLSGTAPSLALSDVFGLADSSATFLSFLDRKRVDDGALASFG